MRQWSALALFMFTFHSPTAMQMWAENSRVCEWWQASPKPVLKMRKLMWNAWHWDNISDILPWGLSWRPIKHSQRRSKCWWAFRMTLSNICFRSRFKPKNCYNWQWNKRTKFLYIIFSFGLRQIYRGWSSRKHRQASCHDVMILTAKFWDCNRWRKAS